PDASIATRKINEEPPGWSTGGAGAARMRRRGALWVGAALIVVAGASGAIWRRTRNEPAEHPADPASSVAASERSDAAPPEESEKTGSSAARKTAGAPGAPSTDIGARTVTGAQAQAHVRILANPE